jgi:methionyl-tRNA formyltransferase
MIVKIDKPFEGLKIGICGFRQGLLMPPCFQLGVKFHFINDLKEITSDFDFVFVTGMYKLIKKAQLDAPKYGVFGFHESPLPEGKGHAPIQWAVFNKRPLTVTLFKFTEGVDAGPIVYQHNVFFEQTDTYPIMEAKRQRGIQECFKICLEELREGVLVLREQSGQESYHKKRTPEDSRLDDSKPLIELWDKIRVCDNEKFPAFFVVGGKKVILRYEVNDSI